jgi:rSAM/selenodomain-associated transferase 2
VQKAPSTSVVITQRLLGLCVSALVLWLVLRRLDAGELAEVLQTTKPGWLLLAFGFYALATLFAALRWHGMLKATGAVVHLGATFRFAFIGNFFNALLLGPAGGDLIKTGLYARWFRQPLPAVVAASFLDRLLGVGGSVFLALAGIALALLADGGEQLNRFAVKWPAWPWVLGTIIVLGLVVWWWKRRKRESFLGRTASSLTEAARQLRHDPGAAGRGLLFGFLLQVCFCGVMACCLQAVASEPVPWLKLAWTFPAIGFAATMPVTIAGAGLREGAATLLFGLYGVDSAESAVAAMLTLLVYVVWALAGGVSFLRERHRLKRVGDHAPPQSLSVIIPALNEAQALPATLAALKQCPDITEIVVVDGGSQDDTVSIARAQGCRVVTSEPGRGKQLHAGTEVATGDALLFLHADTWLDAATCAAILRCLHDPTVAGGGCWKRFRDPHWLMRGSRWRCWTRLQLTRRVLGDQAIFVRRTSLQAVGGFPIQPLMEEFELCRRLRRVGRIALAPATVSTSARRFHQFGVLRTYWLMWRLTFLYHLGKSPEELRAMYERK